jgi:hypothetical protein
MTLAFSSGVVRQASDIEHVVAQIPDAALMGASGLVLRFDAEFWLRLMSDSERAFGLLSEHAEAVSRRAPNVDIFALPDGHSAAVAEPPYVARHGPRLLFRGSDGSVAFETEVDDARLQSIREDDLHQVVSGAQNRCIICAASSYHFALPSGAHASQFIRLSEAFIDMPTVDRIAYWIAHKIEAQLSTLQDKSNFTLLVDHPSMLVLAARVQLLVSVRLSIATFPGYPSDVEARTTTFSFLNQIATNKTAVFVLVGVASTGRLASFVDTWASNRPGLTIQPTTLYAVQDIEGATPLCRLTLPNYEHYETEEACGMCANQSEAVAIHSTNYMVGVTVPKAIALPSSLFQEQREFLSRWGGHEGVLRVHYDDPNESTARHHAYYCDVATLLQIEHFQQEVREKVNALTPRPDAVAVPDHPTAIRIAEIIAGELEIPIITISNEMLAHHRGDRDQHLLSARTLLVADDLFITGSRLDIINRLLRETKEERAPALTHIHFFTLLATPASEQKYAARSNGLTSKHSWKAQLTHLYRFCLPDWHDQRSCPWCREREALNVLAKLSGILDDPISDRISHLSSTNQGLTDRAFNLNGIVSAVPNLGAESVILNCGATALQVLFSCASALQQLRHKSTDPLSPSQFPAPTGLAERVFSTNYSERTVWLGILRSLRSTELHKDLVHFLRAAALDKADGQHPLIHGELAVAWLTGKLGSPDSSEAGRELFESLGIPWQSMFDAGYVYTR